MKLLDTQYIVAGVRKLEATKETFLHMQESYKEIVSEFVKAFQVSDSDATILSGCINSGSGMDYSISAGAIYYNGEIFLVSAFIGTATGVQVPVLSIVTTYRAGDPVTYTDSTSHNTHSIRRLQWNFGDSGAGIKDLSACKTFRNEVFVFPEDVPIVLSGSKSFGKYVNGDTALWGGLTIKEAIIDAVTEYLIPAFTAFSITGQATTVEVGTTLSGSKTFTWTITLGSGVVATIDLYNNTTAATLLAGTANDGTQAQVITTIQLNANGSTQSWKGIGHDIGTDPSDFNSSNFVVTARYYRFLGPVAASPTNSATVRAISAGDFHTGVSIFNLATGTALTKFVVALPPGVTISLVIDLDALNANITSQYVLTGTINVVDAGGTNRSYNIYEMNIGAPYSTDHRHQITTAS